MISLREFIHTGRLGEIGLGSTRAEVETAFGAPTNWDGHINCKRATIWEYGVFRIHISSNIAWMFVLDGFHFPTQVGNALFEADGINSDMDEDEVELWLLEHEIAFQKRPATQYPYGAIFQTMCGVKIRIDRDECSLGARGEDMHLCSISLSRS